MGGSHYDYKTSLSFQLDWHWTWLELSLAKLEQTVHNIKDTLDKYEEKSSKETNELEMIIQDEELTQSVANTFILDQSQPRPSLEVECPVVKPPMRLKQCVKVNQYQFNMIQYNNILLCPGSHNLWHLPCKSWGRSKFSTVWGSRYEGRTHCHTCREVITGRLSVLESVLGLTEDFKKTLLWTPWYLKKYVYESILWIINSWV